MLGTPIVTFTRNGATWMLPRHDERCRFSDLAFEWGKRSAGAEQLAFALSVEVFGLDAAMHHCPTVYRDIVTGLPEDRWEISSQDLHQSVERNLPQRRRA